MVVRLPGVQLPMTVGHVPYRLPGDQPPMTVAHLP
jgi:hypothetical protein